MDPPKLHINDQSPIPDSQGQGKGKEEAENLPTSPTTTRKTMHQNILPKLRPLPFQYHWTVWHDKHNPDESIPYDARLFILHEDVADIATFYRVYNNYPWDKIRLRDSVHIFRKGVKPVWEDPENLRGGCWRFRVPKCKAQAFFHEIAILAMANEFQAVLEGYHDHVLGVSTTVRFKSHLISIWNKLGDCDQSIKTLERTILDRLSPELRPVGGPGPNSYFYRRHSENSGYQQAVESSDQASDPASDPASEG